MQISGGSGSSFLSYSELKSECKNLLQSRGNVEEVNNGLTTLGARVNRECKTEVIRCLCVLARARITLNMDEEPKELIEAIEVLGKEGNEDFVNFNRADSLCKIAKTVSYFGDIPTAINYIEQARALIDKKIELEDKVGLPLTHILRPFKADTASEYATIFRDRVFIFSKIAKRYFKCMEIVKGLLCIKFAEKPFEVLKNMPHLEGTSFQKVASDKLQKAAASNDGMYD